MELCGTQDLIPEIEESMVLQVFKRIFSACNLEQRARVSLLCWELSVCRNVWVWKKKPMSVFGMNSMVTSLVQE